MTSNLTCGALRPQRWPSAVHMLSPATLLCALTSIHTATDHQLNAFLQMIRGVREKSWFAFQFSITEPNHPQFSFLFSRFSQALASKQRFESKTARSTVH